MQGRGNPNCRYHFDDGYLDVIDSEAKAYLLGWIASDGSLRKSGYTIAIHKRDRRILETLSEEISGGSIPVKVKKSGLVYLTINSSRMSSAACRHLSIGPRKKSNIVQFPILTDELKPIFMRGYFEGDGCISSFNSAIKRSRWPSPRCSISSNSKLMLEKIKKYFGGNIYGDHITWGNWACIDYLSKIYKGAESSSLRLSRKYDSYIDWSIYKPAFKGAKPKYLHGFKWIKSRVDAIPPTKSRASDSGFDLCLLEKVKQMGNIELYDTGVKVQPPYGYYFMLVPRSSISKSGYMLSNSLGIIDATYTGSILVPLIKVDKEKPDLTLPCKLVQIVPMPIIYSEIIEVDSLEETERGEGGFGSTGIK